MPLTSLRSVLAMLAMSLCLSLNSFSQTEPTDAKAPYDLGLAYHEGTVVPKDDVEAVKWFRKAANQGDANAQCELGYAYHAGEGVPKDDVEAVKWFRKAADQGHAAAQRTIALAYHEGCGVPKDHTEFLKWLRKGKSVGGRGFAYFSPALESYNPKNYEEEKNWDATELVNWFTKVLDKGGVPHTPKRGSTERQAVADGMRKFVMLYGSEPNPENKKIVTRMDYVKVLDQYALVEGIPLFDDGSSALGDACYTVVLEKIGNTWEPINYDTRGDVGSRGEWVDFLKGLPSDFPLSLLTDLQKKIILGTFPDM
jgi:Sel1 repeat